MILALVRAVTRAQRWLSRHFGNTNYHHAAVTTRKAQP